MPSLKMKIKSTSGSLNGKTSLQVSQKSMVISKSSLSRTTITQVSEVATTIQNVPDVSLCSKVYRSDDGSNEANNSDLLNKDLQSQTEHSSPSDYTATDRTDCNPATSNPGMETIFSPILESIDAHDDSIHDAEGIDNLCVPQLETEESDSSRSSVEYPTCDISDFHISDMIVSCLPIEGNLYQDSLDTMFLPDYKCEESSRFFDEAGEYMVLPSLEDNMGTGNHPDSKMRDSNNVCEEAITNSNESSLYLAIHQLRSCDQGSDAIIYADSDQTEYFDPHYFIRNLPDAPDVPLDLRPPLSKETNKKKTITLVLDLDETLVHSTLEHCDDADFTFPVFFNMKEHTVYVKQRPHLRTFLDRVSEMFEVVIFTASQSIYAKQLLDILDPDGRIISRRAYRESCIFADGSYTKDLTVLGVDLAKVVIIDNSPQVFRLQVNNGIPIKSWFDDPSDSALISLLPFLETLVDADDVRPIIAKRFSNKE